LTGAGTVTIATTQEGASGTNEIRVFDVATELAFAGQSFQLGWSNPSGTTWTGSLTSPTAAAFQAELETIADLTGNVIVTRTGATVATYVYRIEFVNALGGQAIDFATTGSPAYKTATVEENEIPVEEEGGPDAVDEIQTVTINGNPTGGTFTLTFEGQTTTNIAYNASAVAVNAALAPLFNPGEVAVTGSAGGPYTVTFKLGRDVATMTANGAGLTGGGVYVSTIQAAVAAADEQQRIAWGAEVPTGGTFKLGFGAETTGNIAYNANAATVKAALEALTGITTVTVTLNSDGWTVEFNNPGEQDVALMTMDDALLTFGDQVTIATPQTYVRGNEIAWGPKVSGSLAPVFTLRPGAPVILEVLPTTEIGFRPSFDGQRVQVVVFER